jgi:hypothetical protein
VVPFQKSEKETKIITKISNKNVRNNRKIEVKNGRFLALKLLFLSLRSEK